MISTVSPSGSWQNNSDAYCRLPGREIFLGLVSVNAHMCVDLGGVSTVGAKITWTGCGQLGDLLRPGLILDHGQTVSWLSSRWLLISGPCRNQSRNGHPHECSFGTGG